MRAKKSFGQNFLINENLAGAIAKLAMDESPDRHILEVGPGKGVLTKYLIDAGHDFTAVDADRDMISYLTDKYPMQEERLVLQDFLKFDLDEMKDKGQITLLGNFPYNISSQILFKAVDYREQIPVVIGMFQKEVAERVVSKPGSKVYGVVSVLIQAHYEGKIVFRVSPGSFSPAPRVNSAVIMLKRKENVDRDYDFGLFKSIVKISFGQRRKMLRNTMKGIAKDPEFLKSERFEKRPEQLSLEDFIQLTKDIQADNARMETES